MPFGKLVTQALKLAETVAPLLQGTPIGAAVLIGKNVIDLIDNLKANASSDELAALNARRDQLEPLVMAHLDRTIESLG